MLLSRRGRDSVIAKPSTFAAVLFVWWWSAAFIALPDKDSASALVSAFVANTSKPPLRGRNGYSSSHITTVLSNSALLAMRRQLPIPPPHPPSPPDDGETLLGSPGRILDRLVDDISYALDRMDLTELRSQLSGIVSDRDGAFSSSSWIRDLEKQVEELDARLISKLSDAVSSLAGAASGDSSWLTNQAVSSTLQPVVDRLRSAVFEPVLDGALPQWIQLHPTMSLVGSTLLTYAVVSSLLIGDAGPAPSVPYPNGRYDPVTARAYFDSRLPVAIARAAEIFARSASFGAQVLKDYLE
jgi:hypothetical protein